MKRAKKIVITFDNGTKLTADIKLSSKNTLTRDESQNQMDTAVDNTVKALRDIPYVRAATYRNIVVQ